MTPRHIALLATAVVLLESQAGAETCMIHNSGPAGEWKFFRVHDADTGQIVLQQAIKGGDSRQVEVSKERVTVSSKFPGYRQYSQPIASTCKGGNTVKG